MLTSLDTPIYHNSIVVLDGLAPTDMSVDYLVDDLKLLHLHRLDRKKPGVTHIPVRSKLILQRRLHKIAMNCQAGSLHPILHFECHGNPDDGIALGANQERVSWSELAIMLRKINVACGGNLGVVMAACHGMAAIEPISLHEATPFLWLVGRDKKISQGDLRDGLPRFYHRLWTSGALDQACGELKEFRWYNAERFLLEQLTLLYRATATSRRAATVTNALLTLSNEMGCVPPDGLATTRQRLKETVRGIVSPNNLEAIARQFLGPIRRPFTYTQLVERARVH